MSYLPPVDAQTVLDFDRDDMKDCVLSDRTSGQELYSVKTTNNSKTTSICRADEDTPLAVVEHRELLPDKIAFAGGETLNVGEWLRRELLSSYPVTFEQDGKKYMWNRNQDDRLYLTVEGGLGSIAWFQGSKHYLVDGVSQVGSAYLAIERGAEAIRDTVVISMLVLEEKKRSSTAKNVDLGQE